MIRLRRVKRLNADDVLLFVSLLTYIVAIGVFWQTLPAIVEQMNIIQGIEPITSEWLANEVWVIKLNYAAGAMLWASIYAIKLAFLAIFRRLIWHMKILRMWWWGVLVLVLLSCLAAATTYPIICTDLSPTILCEAASMHQGGQSDESLVHCSFSSVSAKQWSYFEYTTVLDILSDVAGAYKWRSYPAPTR